MQINDRFLLNRQFEKFSQYFFFLRRRKSVFYFVNGNLWVPDAETYHIAADVCRHPDQPHLFVLCIAKIRVFLQIPAKRLLYGVLHILLVAEYDNADFIERVAVFYDRFPYVLPAIHVFHLLCLKHT